MAKKEIPAVVEAMVLPIVQELNLELVDVEFVKEGAHWYLRVFLDKDGGIDVEDCSSVSEQLSQLLDEQDPIPQAYMLEVSSPGLDRPLKKQADFAKYAGRLVRVKTYAPVDGKKELVGELKGLEGEDVVLTVEGREVRIPWERAASIRLEIEF
ncbi:MAG: ribosome maturation factor RimP [Clostridia bacterium]|nr:ribosome maturation factor RimP [Clostridia bacterium]